MADDRLKQIEYRGEFIAQVPYKQIQPFNKADAWGFTIDHAFVVQDDFGDHSLPLVQKWFWSPAEAVAAINMRDVIAPRIRGPKWPTTVQYEYNTMIAYRCNFDLVYDALTRIREICNQAKDFDENPRQQIEGVLNRLHVNIHEGTPAQRLSRSIG